METQNITLALPKEVLHKVKLIAVKRRTSVSALLTNALKELVEQSDEYEKARRRQLALMKKGLNLNLGDGPRWTREELHER